MPVWECCQTIEYVYQRVGIGMLLYLFICVEFSKWWFISTISAMGSPMVLSLKQLSLICSIGSLCPRTDAVLWYGSWSNPEILRFVISSGDPFEAHLHQGAHGTLLSLAFPPSSYLLWTIFLSIIPPLPICLLVVGFCIISFSSSLVLVVTLEFLCQKACACY